MTGATCHGESREGEDGSDLLTAKQPHDAKANVLLLLSIFIVAICGLVYELLAGTVSSYLLGDSVYQFSIVIGIFMSSMGLGSFLSRFIKEDLPSAFILVETLVGLIGGLSTLVLFFAFACVDNYTPVLLLICVSVGTLIGLEIPIILRILKDYSSIRATVSNVMTADYIGALVGAVLFPIILLPRLGLMRTAVMFGLLNTLVAALAYHALKHEVRNRKQLLTVIFASAGILAVVAICSGRITSCLEDSLYGNTILYAETTPYQRVVVTRGGRDIGLYLDGSIQFNSRDEYRYHEALVHPAMSHVQRRKNILIIGGGDGLAAREALKYDDVESVIVVDLDATVTDLFRRNRLLRELNMDSLNNDKVTVVNDDAWKFLESSDGFYDVIIIDLPDPRSPALSKLYTRTFYSMVLRHLPAGGAVVAQCTSPLYSRTAFWCIYHTFEAMKDPTGEGDAWSVLPYHAYVPSFGEWGFVLASRNPPECRELPVTVETRFLSGSMFPAMCHFPPDMAELDTAFNTIDTHRLVQYYNQGWGDWYQ